MAKLTKTVIKKLADAAGISIGAHEGSPFPTYEQLGAFIEALRALDAPSADGIKSQTVKAQALNARAFVESSRAIAKTISVSDSDVRLTHIAADLAKSPIHQVCPGEKIKILSEYNFESCLVVAAGPKNVKVKLFDGRETSVAKEKCATYTEPVAVVWETWRGGNGRGGYRLERSMFEQERIPAARVARQSNGEGRLTEDSFGVLRPSRNLKASP